MCNYGGGGYITAFSAHAAESVLEITGAYSVTDDTISELNKYEAVNLSSDSSCLTIDIANDATISCLITNKGSVVKKGAGLLSLSNKSRGDGYNAAGGWRIETGGVALPTEKSSSTTSAEYKLTNVYIEDGAELRICPVAGVANRIVFAGGSGLVTNASASASNKDADCPNLYPIGTFGGTISSYIKGTIPYQDFTFTGENHMCGNNMIIMGATFTVSSNEGIGEAYQVLFNSNNSYLRYNGTGDSVFSKRFVFNDMTNAGFDGGDTGGVTINPLNLSLGDKVKDCYFKGAAGTNIVCLTQANMSGAAARVIKDGDCAWWFQHNRERYLRGGATEVRGGKLMIDALFDKGEVCALGVGTNAAKSVSAVSKFTEDLAVPYGVLLSGGELEFIGSTNAAFAVDRGIGVSADSKLTDNGQSVIFGFDGVQCVGSTPRTLTLGGTNALSRLDNVEDGDAVLSLKKVGSGTWTLGGNQTFSGLLDVQEGSVRVLNDGDKTKYTYFRLQVTESAMARFKTSGGSPVQINHWGLFDKDGNRLGRQVKDAATFGNGNLQENETGWARDTGFYDHVYDADTGTPQGMFNEADYRYYQKNIPNVAPTLTIPTSWQRIVVRLADDIEEVTTYDIITPNNMSSTRMVCSWIVDGSVDGIHWTQLDEQQCPVGVTNRTDMTWVYDNAAFVKTTGKHTGFPIKASREAQVYNQLANATVRVAPNAALVAEGEVTLSSLSADAEAGMGTISGFTFAESGTFDIKNITKAGAKFTSAIKAAQNAANIAKWTLSVDGKVSSKYNLSIDSNGTITVMPQGILVIIR